MAEKRAPEPEMPVSTLNEALPLLRRPFAPEAIQFKIQSVFKEAKGCLVVAYIDARLVIERLNAVAGEAWEPHFKTVEGLPHMLWCNLQVFGSVRSDIGEGQGQTEGMKRKAAVSDALKRAAVHFGVGVSVYALPQITLYRSQPHVEPRKTQKGETLALTEAGHVKLREGYAKWLETKNTFGPAMAHGDVEGPTIDIDEVAAEEEFVPAPPPAVSSERADELVDRIRAEYEKVDARRLPAQRFNAMLQGARVSEDELERFLAYVEGLPRKGEA